MNPQLALALQVVNFLWANKDAIKQAIQGIEETIGNAAPGSAKAQAVKDFIAHAMQIEGQIEAAWPMVAPFFNLVVAAVKAPKAA